MIKVNKNATCRAKLNGIHLAESMERGHGSVDLARDETNWSARYELRN